MSVFILFYICTVSSQHHPGVSVKAEVFPSWKFYCFILPEPELWTVK